MNQQYGEIPLKLVIIYRNNFYSENQSENQSSLTPLVAIGCRRYNT